MALAASYAADPRAQAIAQAAQALVTVRDRWLNPSELVERVPEAVAGFPDRLVPKDATAAAALRGRTLTALYNQRGTPAGAWLDALHRALDEAVAAAYGWPANLSDDDVLARLLALNHARAESSRELDGSADRGISVGKSLTRTQGGCGVEQGHDLSVYALRYRQ
jgi:hypothetical protein